jgi:hypothetical protein
MNTKEQIEAALKQARANRDEAAAKRTRAGTEWRSIQEDPTATYPKVRSAWALADAEWNLANALIDKLTAQLKELEQIATINEQRTGLEVALNKARVERDRADAALAAAARARAERENAAEEPARTERRGSIAERRRHGNDRRKSKGDRRKAQPAPAAAPANAAKRWSDAVAIYNQAQVELNRAQLALSEFNRTHAK